MQTKLTLTIDKLVVEEAKRYAHQRHKSVSSMVEDYLRTFSELSARSDSIPPSPGPVTESLFGSFRGLDNERDPRAILEEALVERYLK